MRFIVLTKKFILRMLAVAILIIASTAIIFKITVNEEKTAMVMGAVLIPKEKDTQDKKEAEKHIENWNEYYFRPSKLTALNDKKEINEIINAFGGKEPSKITLPKELLKTPQDSVINYFSVLREAENMIEGRYGGCGTVGQAKLPYPIAYNFLSTEYKKKTSYEDFLDSFKGIAHINLIKLKNITEESAEDGKIKYFVEIETLEPSSSGSTYFAYYYGYIYLINESAQYKISDMELTAEDFLCAPYHGWKYKAEDYVDIAYGDWCKLIKKRLPTVQEGYVKDIVIEGTDGRQYKFKFIQLTNGVDIEVSQFVKEGNKPWKSIKINPEDCIDEKEAASRL